MNRTLTWMLVVGFVVPACGQDKRKEDAKKAPVTVERILSVVGEKKPERILQLKNSDGNAVRIVEIKQDGKPTAQKAQSAKRTEARIVKIEKPSVVVRGTGKIVVVGPDGKRREFDFDTKEDDQKGLFEKLPKDVRDKLKSALKHSDENKAESSLYRFRLSRSMEIPDYLVLPNEIPKDVRETIKKALQPNKKGTAIGYGILLGPEGKRYTVRIPAGLDKMPRTLREFAIPATKQRVEIRSAKSATDSAAKATAETNAKLDLILKRLSKIEDELNALKKQVKN